MRKTGEWGQFLPPHVIPFAYNETLAQDYFPLAKEQAEGLGYRWQNESPVETAAGLPTCVRCEHAYQITTQEKRLYEKLGLLEPDTCPKCRHKIRLLLRNPRYLWGRECFKCGDKMPTSFSPQKPEQICCEKCYLQAI